MIRYHVPSPRTIATYYQSTTLSTATHAMPKSVMPMPLPMPMTMDPGYLLQHRVAHEQDATAAETSADRGPIKRRQLAPG